MSDLRIETYTLDHYRAMTGEKENLGMASLNQVAGPGFALIDGGKVIAIGGVRVQGVGQAWALLSPAVLGDDDGKFDRKNKVLMTTARSVLEECIRNEHLYRIYAEASVDKPAFYEHLGFQLQNNLWVR